MLVIINRHRRRTKRKVRRRRQKGDAAIRDVNRMLGKTGPSTQDKKAYAMSMFLSGPAPGLGTLGRILGKQALKGVMDNIQHYRNRRR